MEGVIETMQRIWFWFTHWFRWAGRKPTTYREKLEKEHPTFTGSFFHGGCAHCPAKWGYESSYACDTKKSISCKECWDRPLPEMEDEDEMPEVWY